MPKRSIHCSKYLASLFIKIWGWMVKNECHKIIGDVVESLRRKASP